VDEKCILVKTITHGLIQRGLLSFEEFEKAFNKYPDLPDPKIQPYFSGALTPRFHFYYEVVDIGCEKHQKWIKKSIVEEEY